MVIISKKQAELTFLSFIFLGKKQFQITINKVIYLKTRGLTFIDLYLRKTLRGKDHFDTVEKEDDIDKN